MRMSYFGDSFDIVKQSLLRWLGEFGEWSVHPMFTEKVSPPEVDAFRRFLGAKIISTEVLKPDTNRHAYFACASSCGNLFLDPDTGLRMQPIGRIPRTDYLFEEELLRIAQPRPNSLTLVFDQSLPRGSEKYHLAHKLRRLSQRGLFGFAYCSHASFVVVGHSASPVKDALVEIIARSRLPVERFLDNSSHDERTVIPSNP